MFAESQYSHPLVVEYISRYLNFKKGLIAFLLVSSHLINNVGFKSQAVMQVSGCSEMHRWDNGKLL